MELRRSPSDRTHNLQITYNYDIPGMGRAFHVKGLGYITDHWAFSGITSLQGCAPFNIGCGFAPGASATTGGTAGTPDITGRCNVVGYPQGNLATNPNGQVYFNAAAIR